MSYCLPYLPNEIVRNILTRLPIKTLVRFMVVSKSWFSLIKSPDFITDHLSHISTSTSSDNGGFVVQIPEFKAPEQFLVYEDHESCDRQYRQKFGSNDYGLSWMMGDCNGVLCLIVQENAKLYSPSSDYEHLDACYGDVILWNPSIRRWLPLPPPRITMGTHRMKYFVLGFGFDSQSNDYKVVRLAYLINDMAHVIDHPEVEVFDLRIGSWRGFSGDVPSYHVNPRSTQFHKGFVYWKTYINEHSKLATLSFDMREEVFHIKLFPDIMQRRKVAGSPVPSDLTLTVFRDSLCVLQHNDTISSVWVLEEYDVAGIWTKLYNLELSPFWKTLGFRRNGEEALMRCKRDQLVLYHLKSQQVMELGIDDDFFDVKTFTESLELLDVGTTISPREEDEEWKYDYGSEVSMEEDGDEVWKYDYGSEVSTQEFI